MEAARHALIARFRADYERLLHADDPPDHRIALAVSGGPDSMAMLGLAAEAFPGRTIAATVDHGLRPESAGEAVMVGRACGKIGIPHDTLKIDVPPGASGNLHDWARQERYRLLTRWAAVSDASVLCTAHHAEDQAETFLMRAARATGVSGLAAVRARTDGVDPAGAGTSILLLRPLLRWRRAELRAAAECLRLPFIDDPSNRDPRYDRTRFRAWLAEAPWIDPVQIGRTAENMAAVETDLEEVSGWLWETRRRAGSDPCDLDLRVDVAELPRGVKRYLARSAIDCILRENGMSGGNWNPASNIEPLLDALEAGSAATQANVLASAKGDIWHFRAAPPRRSP